jgi:hypothetical protein
MKNRKIAIATAAINPTIVAAQSRIFMAPLGKYEQQQEHDSGEAN